MASIVLSSDAPQEDYSFSIGSTEFGISPSGKYETSDKDVLATAEAHPWLEVEYDKSEKPIAAYRKTVKPEEDVLAAANSVAFDPAHIKADREAVLGTDEVEVAVEAAPVAVDKKKKPAFSLGSNDEGELS